MKAQCERKSPKGRACLFDAEPVHDLHMNMGETWSDPATLRVDRISVATTGMLSDLDQRMAAEPLDVLGRPRGNR
jgi:hypothetical protein